VVGSTGDSNLDIVSGESPAQTGGRPRQVIRGRGLEAFSYRASSLHQVYWFVIALGAA
jgi:hypothetical protein